MADEDERWLYGDSNQDEEEQDGKENADADESTNNETHKNIEFQPPEITREIEKDALEKEEENVKRSKTEEEALEKIEITENEKKQENGELENDKRGENEEEEAEDEDEEEEDDSDEDNVNVIIGDLNKSGPTYTNINIPKRGPTITGPGVKSAGKFSMEDFESVGIINGVPAHEFNVDVIEDKPWRIPGADITDYFNYGFNEETWKAYCERQKRIRIHESCTGLPTQTLAGQSWTNTSGGGQNSQYSNTQSSGGKKTGWETGQIRVIGSGVASRRLDESTPENQNIQVIPANNNFAAIPPPNLMPQLIPPMEMPPPGFPSGADPYGGGPPTNEYFNPEPEYFPSYEPTAADQWRDGWAPGNLVTFGQSVKPVLSHIEDTNCQDRPLVKEREKDRERDHELDRDRERNLDREDKEKRKERSHRNRSRSKSHERKRKSRSRSPSHKKHKKKSKKSDRKKRSDDTE